MELLTLTTKIFKQSIFHDTSWISKLKYLLIFRLSLDLRVWYARQDAATGCINMKWRVRNIGLCTTTIRLSHVMPLWYVADNLWITWKQCPKSHKGHLRCKGIFNHKSPNKIIMNEYQHPLLNRAPPWYKVDANIRIRSLSPSRM